MLKVSESMQTVKPHQLYHIQQEADQYQFKLCHLSQSNLRKGRFKEMGGK